MFASKAVSQTRSQVKLSHKHSQVKLSQKHSQVKLCALTLTFEGGVVNGKHVDGEDLHEAHVGQHGRGVLQQQPPLLQHQAGTLHKHLKAGRTLRGTAGA